jgi:hypothetical protein
MPKVVGFQVPLLSCWGAGSCSELQQRTLREVYSRSAPKYTGLQGRCLVTMLLTQRSRVFIPCPVHRALRPTAKLARDTGQGSRYKGIGMISSKGLVQEINITRNQPKEGCPKMSLQGLGVQVCSSCFSKC